MDRPRMLQAGKLEWLVKTRKWRAAFELLLQADTGNSWAKNYGPNYDGNRTVHDSYGFLSEYAHPNAACFLQYRDSEGREAFLLKPPPRSTFGGINGFILEWLILIHKLLSLAKEDVVR